MPVQSCHDRGRPGFKAGPTGKCYTYKANNTQSKVKARERAEKQLQAIKAKEAK